MKLRKLAAVLAAVMAGSVMLTSCGSGSSSSKADGSNTSAESATDSKGDTSSIADIPSNDDGSVNAEIPVQIKLSM